MKKRFNKIIALSMVLMLCFSSVNVTAFADDTVEESTVSEHLTYVPDGYIGIYTKEDLNNVRNDLSGKYILMNDIIFTEEDFTEDGDFYNEGYLWDPIGGVYSPFKGIFDGNGYIIKNLKSYSLEEYVGFFGRVNGKIRDLGIENLEITAPNTQNETSRCGGITGALYGTITDCHTSGSITSHAAAGLGCFTGGIAGDNKGSIDRCYNAALVHTKADNSDAVGGIAGFNEGTINRCYNIGDVIGYGTTFTGGIAGESNWTISNCFNCGEAKGAICPAGIVGTVISRGSVSSCYNISSNPVIGEYEFSRNIDGCYYLTYQGAEVLSGCYGLNGKQMEDKSNFKEFDFDNVWAVESNSEYDYPYLKDVELVEFPLITSCESISVSDEIYTGNYLLPDVDLIYNDEYLMEGQDYVISNPYYCKDVGIGIVRIAGKGKYKSYIDKAFRVKPADIDDFLSKDNLIINYEEFLYYDGNVKTPPVAIEGIELHQGKDYILSYENNLNAGTAKVIIEGIGNYTGTSYASFEIKPIDLPEVELEYIETIYDHKAKKPEVTIKNLTTGVDFIVTYGENTNVGEGTVTITGIGNYTGTVIETFNIKPPAPTGVKVTTVASNGKPYVSWSKVDGVDKYEVWRKVGKNGTWEKQYTTKGTSYTNTSAEVGTKYYYKVRAVHTESDAFSEFSKEDYVTCDLPRPTGFKVTTLSSNGKPDVSWNKVAGADKYEVWRKVGKNGTWKKQYTTKETSYTNTSAEAGTVYYYKVKAVYADNTIANSAFSASDYVTCDLAKPKISVSGTKKKGKIVISWNKVSNADRYYIYRATSKNGTYEYYASTKGTTYTNSSVKKGKYYYYKVKAIYDDKSVANSAYSNMDYAWVR